MPNRFFKFTWFCFAAAISNIAHSAIIISGYSDATNDRFANSGTFVGAGLDFSGVGQDSSGRWGTAISRNVVISAFHFAPSGTIQFYAGNNPGLAPVVRTLTSSIKIGSTDLYLGVLDQALPANIRSYAFSPTPLTGPNSTTIANAGSLQGVNAYLMGVSPATRSVFQDQAVGRNLITGYTENIDFLGNTDNDVLLFHDDTFPTPGTDFVASEAYLQVGDSGAPAFVVQNGELVLIGTNAFIYEGANQGVPFRGSAINYTGNQSNAINAFVSAVPEPSSIIMLSLTVVGVCCSRRLARPMRIHARSNIE